MSLVLILTFMKGHVIKLASRNISDHIQCVEITLLPRYVKNKYSNNTFSFILIHIHLTKLLSRNRLDCYKILWSLTILCCSYYVRGPIDDMVLSFVILTINGQKD